MACDCSRRSFLQGSAATAAVAGLGVSTGGCGDEADVSDELSGEIALTFDAYPQLQAGELVELGRDVTGTAFRIYVRKQADDSWLALSSKCPHESCSIRKFGDSFTCPCHDSEFAADGAYVFGPANRAMYRYDVRETADGLVIGTTAT